MGLYLKYPLKKSYNLLIKQPIFFKVDKIFEQVYHQKRYIDGK